MEFTFSNIPLPRNRASSQLQGTTVKPEVRSDFICYDQVIVELKALKTLCDEHRAQVHNYLKATGMRLGLLVNFGHYPKVEWNELFGSLF